MTTAVSLAAALGYWLVGAVLFRALAVRLLQFDGLCVGAPGASERDLLLQSILPALAITGTIGTYLALTHLFRADVTIAGGIVALIWRRKDTAATVRAARNLIADGIAAILRGNLLVLIALVSLLGLTSMLFVFSYVPSSNIDTWVFQLPLAQSMVDHHGFIYPQIGHPFYSNNPLFFNLLFAQGLLFVDHFFAAATMNILVYVGFLICLASFAPRARALGWLVVLLFIASSRLFAVSAAEPLIDLPRSCFSVLSLLFAYRYSLRPRMYELVVSGLLAGAAISGKYTELLTPCLIGLGLLPTLLRDRRRWLHVMGFTSAIIVVATYWYAKNWILLHNPLYPFLFAHPGLTDDWMAGYMGEMRRAFNPADRVYVTNLLTLQGWRDFFFIFYDWFFAGRPFAELAAVMLFAGAVTPRIRIGILAFWSAMLFVIWYGLMFNSIRWAMPAYLLFLSTGFLAFAYLFDRTLEELERRGRAPSVQRCYAACQWIASYARRSQTSFALVSLIGAVAVAIAAGGTYRIAQYSMDLGIFRRLNVDLLRAAFSQSSMDEYLSTRREGYTLYRYVAQHDLRKVLQPFDNGVESYAAAYNGGRDGQWFIPYTKLPPSAESIERFLADNEIRYFVYRPELTDGEIDIFGETHVGKARAIFAALLPRSRLLLTDSFGWSLYEIVGPPTQTR